MRNTVIRSTAFGELIGESDLWWAIPPGAPPRAVDRVLTDSLGRMRKTIFRDVVPTKVRRLHYLAFRDGWRCCYCGIALTPNTATEDHVYPRARGGQNLVRNLVLACRTCNSRKGARHPGSI